MISHFKKLGYEPIVGDSFTEDTPVFIKYNSGEIDIKPICELIDEGCIEKDTLGREYDYSKKPYKVLCRSGWVWPTYIYRHKTDKDIYEVTDGEMKIEVTEDHSLFDYNKEKIKPSEINEQTKLEYYYDNIEGIHSIYFENQAAYIKETASLLANGKIDRVPIKIINCSKPYQKMFYETFMENQREDINYSKTCLAGLLFLKNA